MIVTPYTYTEELSFKPDNNRLPPCNIEAEEAVLGGILLDPIAIYLIKDRLKPEHFYIGAHQDIYKACLRLSKKGQPTDLLHVTSWLSDHELLIKIGGRNKLATLVDRTVSATNIDSLAGLLMINAKRREAIKTAHELEHLAYDTKTEWADVCLSIENKIKEVISVPVAPTKEENDLWHCNRLVEELENIYLKVADPALKLFKLHQLANANPDIRGGVKGLEDLYMKSLCATVEARKSLDELEEEVGTEGRKWLLGGILPQATTTLVIADGGVGKTKFLYDLLYCIGKGENWNGFPATADSRNILIYQGDESKHDMLQALNKRGFKPGTEIRKRTGVRFGWNTEAMPILYKDAAEFKPAVIMIDSLTFASRYSLYDENRTEYSRPILELNKFAAETGITVVIVHHTNKNGGARGTTAVRNAVSEVIKLEKDPNPRANPQEKILTIEKSRSRRFPASYRLFFNEEDFSFSLLEEVGQELGSPDITTKDRIVKFLQEHANRKFEAEEVAHEISTTAGNARRCLSQLARDGLVSLDERSFTGTRKLYYIVDESENCSTKIPLQSVHNLTITSSPRISSENDSTTCQAEEIAGLDQVYKNDGSPVISSMISLDDQLTNHNTNHLPETVSDENWADNLEADHLSTSENAILPNPGSDKKINIDDDHLITLAGKPELASNPEADPQADPQADHEVITGKGDRLKADNSVLHRQVIEEGQVYLSLSIGKRVKVKKLFPSVKKADVYIAGDPFTIPRLPLSDLYPLPAAEKWKPMVNQLAMYGGELVVVVGFKSGGREYQVEFKSGQMVYVKASRLTCPC